MQAAFETLGRSPLGANAGSSKDKGPVRLRDNHMSADSGLWMLQTLPTIVVVIQKNTPERKTAKPLQRRRLAF
jgi:hypothetical protein